MESEGEALALAALCCVISIRERKGWLLVFETKLNDEVAKVVCLSCWGWSVFGMKDAVKSVVLRQMCVVSVLYGDDDEDGYGFGEIHSRRESTAAVTDYLFWWGTTTTTHF